MILTGETQTLPPATLIALNFALARDFLKMDKKALAKFINFF